MEEKKIGFIGAGKMATAIAGGIVNSGFFDKKNVFAYDVNESAREAIKNNLGVNTVRSTEELLRTCNIILMATKPFVVNEVLDDIKDKVNNHLLISILAGVTTEKIENKLTNTRVIRIMPNTPALVNCAMSAVCKGKLATEDDFNFTVEMFSNIGRAIKTEEKYIDIITAVSGSGPAYFYYFINEMAKAGEKLGLDYTVALELAAQTALGSAEMILKTKIEPETLIRNVTTPGGCTEVGNNVLKDAKTDEIIFKTIKDTMEKAKSLG